MFGSLSVRMPVLQIKFDNFESVCRRITLSISKLTCS